MRCQYFSFDFLRAFGQRPCAVKVRRPESVLLPCCTDGAQNRRRPHALSLHMVCPGRYPRAPRTGCHALGNGRMRNSMAGGTPKARPLLASRTMRAPPVARWPKRALAASQTRCVRTYKRMAEALHALWRLIAKRGCRPWIAKKGEARATRFAASGPGKLNGKRGWPDAPFYLFRKWAHASACSAKCAFQ